MTTATRPTFTEREVELVRLIARGYTAQECAETMGIGTRTIKAYSDALRLKLQVDRRRVIPQAYMLLTGDDPYPRA